MANIINLTCPSCGGKLQITSDLERFSCGYCGNEILVQRSGGAITFEPVVTGLKDVKTGVDKTASELAITRIRAEIDEMEKAQTQAVWRLDKEYRDEIDQINSRQIARRDSRSSNGCATVILAVLALMLLIAFVVVFIATGEILRSSIPGFLALIFGLLSFFQGKQIGKWNNDMQIADAKITTKGRRYVEKRAKMVGEYMASIDAKRREIEKYKAVIEKPN